MNPRRNNPPRRKPKPKPEWWDPFLEQLRKRPLLRAAHKAVGNRGADAHHYWIRKSKVRKREFEDALAEGTALLEEQAHNMAETDPVMTRWLLTKLMPDKYGDKTKHEHEHNVNLPPQLADSMARFYGTPQIERHPDDERPALPAPDDESVEGEVVPWEGEDEADDERSSRSVPRRSRSRRLSR